MEKTMIDFKQATKLYTYKAYKELVVNRFEKGMATGDIHNEARLSATKINLQRIKRLDKQVKINDDLQDVISLIKNPINLYLISEGWCGDSAQTTPIIAKIAEQSDKLNLKILLRDENPEIIDAYLTNGGKAIPKLIAVDAISDEELWTWGPRPSKIAKMVQEYKAKYTLDNHDEFVKNLHLWYAKDKHQALQEDFIALLLAPTN